MKIMLFIVATVVVLNALFVVFSYRRGCALEEMRKLDHGEIGKGASK